MQLPFISIFWAVGDQRGHQQNDKFFKDATKKEAAVETKLSFEKETEADKKSDDKLLNFQKGLNDYFINDVLQLRPHFFQPMTLLFCTTYSY